MRKDMNNITKELNGKKCILFGVNDFVGKNLLDHLSKANIGVGLIDIDAKKFDTNLLYKTVIPGNEESFKKAISEIVDTLGEPDFLLLSYYFDEKVKFSLENPDLKKWDVILRNWVDSYFLMAKNTIPFLLKNGSGRIVFINTVAGYTGEKENVGTITGNFSIYESVASSAITGIMTSMARQIIPLGISVNSVAIGSNYAEDLPRINWAMDLWLSGMCEYACGQIIRLY
jgi:NAD(P)-dependent dehydrogenase (short-subunit alcohol dehydrogenase family)